MNLEKLFEMQKKLREKIINNHNLENVNLLDNMILALQVELGELANEWKGFKHWSNNREMNKEKALEEYADCLSFILEIGLELEIQSFSSYTPTPYIFDNDVTLTFTHLMADAAMMNFGLEKIEKEYVIYVNHFLYLGSMLGFTWEQVEQAYMEKNAENHRRQESGY